MASNKNDSLTYSNVLTQTGLSGKTFTGLNIFRHGVTVVIEIKFSGGSQLLKVKQGRVEYGGDHDFGTGTEIQ